MMVIMMGMRGDDGSDNNVIIMTMNREAK